MSSSIPSFPTDCSLLLVLFSPFLFPYSFLGNFKKSDFNSPGHNQCTQLPIRSFSPSHITRLPYYLITWLPAPYLIRFFFVTRNEYLRGPSSIVHNSPATSFTLFPDFLIPCCLIPVSHSLVSFLCSLPPVSKSSDRLNTLLPDCLFTCLPDRLIA